MNNKKDVKKNGGFTIVELIVVASLLGILSIVIVPNMSSTVNKSYIDYDLAYIEDIESAALFYFSINQDYPFDVDSTQTSANFDDSLEELEEYIEVKSFEIATNVHWEQLDGYWYVSYQLPDGVEVEEPISEEPDDPGLDIEDEDDEEENEEYEGIPLWSPDVDHYNGGDRVIYLGDLYEARYYVNKNQVPGSLSTPWQQITDEWRFFNIYDGMESVYHDGNLYVSRYYTQNQEPGLVSSPWQEITNEWRDFNIYDTGNQVTYNGATFEARNYTKDQEPGLISSPWQEITNEWRDFNVYNSGDRVEYEGKNYEAKWWTQNDIPGSTPVWRKLH